MPRRKIADLAVVSDTLRGAKIVDVARQYAQVIACGYQPAALKVTVYGMRDFSLTDPDGHRLSFGQDESG